MIIAAPRMESGPRIERAARAIVALATVWYVIALGWGLFAPVGAGHDALVAARAIIADNMLTWGIPGPVREYTLVRPEVNLYYAHHPWGTFWLIAAFTEVLGRHAYVPRLVTILMSAAVPPMIYGVGRRLWGPVPGALSALAYVVLPITLAFGNLSGFEAPLIFATMLTAWGFVRFVDGWRWRWMLVSLLGVLWGVNVDWEYCIFIGVLVAAFAIAAFFLPPRVFGRLPPRPIAQWMLLATGISVLGVGFYVWYFHHIGSLDALLNSETKRSRGADMPLQYVLANRSYWIDATFTPLAVLLGKIAVPVLLVRIVLGRRLLEMIPVAILIMSVVEYVKFKNGADVHIYWPYPFAPYAALSLGVLAASTIDVTYWLIARFGHPSARAHVPWIVLVLFELMPLLILPDGVDGLRYARATGGRFNEKGSRMFDDTDKVAALGWMAKRMAPHTAVQMHEGMHSMWADDWALRRPLRSYATGPINGGAPEERYFVGDLRFMTNGDQRRMAENFHVIVVDQFALVDRLEPRAPADVYVFDERPPTAFEWYFSSGPHPVRTVRPDAWATWEMRDAWGQLPNPPPAGMPQTPEQIRIAHNIAVASGDTAAAQHLLESLPVERGVAAKLADGTRLVGERYHPGVSPTLSLYFEASGPSDNDFEFAVASVVVKRKTLSLVRADERIKTLGVPFLVSPRFWRQGFIYSEKFSLFDRPGRERYWGYMTALQGSRPAHPIPSNEVPLLELP